MIGDEFVPGQLVTVPAVVTSTTMQVLHSRPGTVEAVEIDVIGARGVGTRVMVSPESLRAHPPAVEAREWKAEHNGCSILTTDPINGDQRVWFDEVSDEAIGDDVRRGEAAAAVLRLRTERAASRAAREADVRVEAMCRTAYGEREWDQAAPEFRSERRAGMHRAMLAGLAGATS